MFGFDSRRLVHSAPPRPAESAVILFGATAATLGAMALAIVWAATTPSVPVGMQGFALTIGALVTVLVVLQLRAHHSIESRRSMAFAGVAATALLLSISLASGIAANAQETAFTSGDVVVTTDDLNLRDDASVDATLIETLPTGTPVTITSDPITSGDYTWYAVESDYGDGYVVADYLADPATIPTGTSVSINTDVLNLRTAAGTDSEVTAELDSGTEITIVSDPTVLDGITWYEVDTAAGSGWVAGEYLTVIAA